MTTKQATKNAISLKGSAQIVTEFLGKLCWDRFRLAYCDNTFHVSWIFCSLQF